MGETHNYVLYQLWNAFLIDSGTTQRTNKKKTKSGKEINEPDQPIDGEINWVWSDF